MAMFYYKTYKVPMWVVLQPTQKKTTLLKWFKQAEAHLQPWPSSSFGETLLSYRNKGWRPHLPKEFPFVLNPQLLAVAATEHVKKTLGITSQIAFQAPPHHTNRKMESEADFERVFDELLTAQAPINLSQMFQVGEKCHQEGRRNYKVFVSEAPVNKNVLTNIADRVITIGESDDCDINVAKVNAREAPKFLERSFQELLSHQQ